MSKKFTVIWTQEDSDHCCVCFGSYQEDNDTAREIMDIVQSQEDCIDEEESDANGKLY